MYCPLCGAEYRPGFTVCSDCQVDLVPDAPHAPDANPNSEHSRNAPFVLVWSGNDALTHAKISETLDRQRIPARTLGSEDHLFNISNRSAFEVYVPADLANSARQAIAHDFTGEEFEEKTGSDLLEIPEDEGAAEGYEDHEGERTGRQNLDPQEATVEIWFGHDGDVAAMIASSLRENEIIFRSDSQTAAPEDTSDDPRPTSLFVYPEDERRAKAIVREIVEAAPPE